jgi:hypothetical protein
MSQNITSVVIATGTTLKVSERPNSVGKLIARPGFWFNASVECVSPDGFSSFGDFKVYVDCPDKAAAESKVNAITGHIAQGHKVYVEMVGGKGELPGWPLSGVKKWSTKDEGGAIRSFGVDFLVNVPLAAIRFFAKGVLEATSATAAVTALATAPVVETPAPAPAVAEAPAKAIAKRGAKKSKAPAAQPELIAA